MLCTCLILVLSLLFPSFPIQFQCVMLWFIYFNVKCIKLHGWYRENFINMAANMLALIVISYIVPDYQKEIWLNYFVFANNLVGPTINTLAQKKGPTQANLANNPLGPARANLANNHVGSTHTYLANNPVGPTRVTVANNPKGPTLETLANNQVGPTWDIHANNTWDPQRTSLLILCGACTTYPCLYSVGPTKHNLANT